MKTINTKKLSYLLYFLIIIFSKQVYGSHTEYFIKAKLDNKVQILGKYHIKEETALKINCYKFFYNDKQKLEKVVFLKKGKIGKDPFFGVADINIEYIDNIEKRAYLNEKSIPTADTSGVYIIRIKYNEDNNPIGITNFDQNDMICKDNNGVCQYSWSLDDKGRRYKSIRLDKFGHNITDKQGVYEMEYVYDNKNNVMEVKMYGPKKNKLKETIEKYAIIHWEYDAKGNIIEESFYDANNKLRESSDGSAIIRYSYDLLGNITEKSYYGFDNSLAGDDYNVAIIKMKYDVYSNKIEESYYGTNKQLVNNEEGAAIIKWEYNDDGNIYLEKYLDKNEKPVNNFANYSMVKWIYYSDGSHSKTQYYNKNNELVQGKRKYHYQVSIIPANR